LLAQTTDVRALEALRREINYEGKIMFSKFATAAVAATLSLAASAAMAGAGDYSFDPVNPEMKKGDDMADNASSQVLSFSMSRAAAMRRLRQTRRDGLRTRSRRGRTKKRRAQ
jgi:hypothetical protein